MFGKKKASKETKTESTFKEQLRSWLIFFGLKFSLYRLQKRLRKMQEEVDAKIEADRKARKKK